MSASDYDRLTNEAEHLAGTRLAGADREPTVAEQRAALWDTFIEWLEAERYDEVIGFIVHQYRSVAGFPGGFEFVREVCCDLRKKSDRDRLHLLFSGILPPRFRDYWFEHKNAEAGLLGNVANAAECKGELQRLLFEFFKALHALGCEKASECIREHMIALSINKKRPFQAKVWSQDEMER